jgi:hypothetical protein
MQSHRMSGHSRGSANRFHPPNPETVISTEAAHSRIVSSVVEKSASLPRSLPRQYRALAFPVAGYTPITIRICGDPT